MLPIASVEMRRRMIVIVDHDHNPKKFAYYGDEKDLRKVAVPASEERSAS